MFSVFTLYQLPQQSDLPRPVSKSSNLDSIRHLAYPRSLCPSPLPSLALHNPAAYNIALYFFICLRIQHVACRANRYMGWGT